VFKLISVLSLAIVCESLRLNCNFILYNWWSTPNAYTCKATVQMTGHARNVEAISGTHLSGKGSSNVVGLWIDNQRGVNVIPQNVLSFFPNLKLFTVSSCGIRTVAASDFEQFGSKLQSLGLHDNYIEQINHDLLESLTNLKLVSFSDNYIRNIGLETFDRASIPQQQLHKQSGC
jgi:Leucine-rich repeat (LRR) protein